MRVSFITSARQHALSAYRSIRSSSKKAKETDLKIRKINNEINDMMMLQNELEQGYLETLFYLKSYVYCVKTKFDLYVNLRDRVLQNSENNFIYSDLYEIYSESTPHFLEKMRGRFTFQNDSGPLFKNEKILALLREMILNSSSADITIAEYCAKQMTRIEEKVGMVQTKITELEAAFENPTEENRRFIEAGPAYVMIYLGESKEQLGDIYRKHCVCKIKSAHQVK